MEENQRTGEVEAVRSIRREVAASDRERARGVPLTGTGRSRTSGLTYNLRTGGEIDLADELVSDTRRDELYRRIAEETRAAISEKLGEYASECPNPEKTPEFFLTARAIVFVEMFPSHVDSACEVEVPVPLESLQSDLREGSLLLEDES